MTDKDSPRDDVRRTEALFRFGAALPPRDDLDEDLYREWHARDARRPSGLTTYGCAPHLPALTPGQLHQLAEADVQAQAEYDAELRESAAEAQGPSQWELEAEAEAGF